MNRMHELDIVIKGLKCCQDETGESCRVCPYREHLNPTGGKPAGWCRFEVRRDALALLKKQDDDSTLLDWARSGKVLKHKGGGVVVFNEEWYMEHRDREAPRELRKAAK